MLIFKSISLCVVWFVIISSPKLSFGQDATRDPALIEAAKKDGEVVWYTMMSVHIVEALRAKFEETFPFVRLKFFRIRSGDQANRIAAEATTGRHEFDVATTNAATAYTLKKRGFVKPYFPAEAKLLAPAFRDPEGYWYAATFAGYALAYNTDHVKAPPKSYDELLSPSWKGKVGLDTQDYDWLGFQLRIRGEEQGLAFVRKLAKNLVMRKGHTLGVQLVAAGEILAFINGNSAQIFAVKDKGAPIDMTLPSPVFIGPRVTSLSANSPHEGAARFFLEWLFSRETARFITEIGRTTSRSDVERFPPALSKVSDFFSLDATYYENQAHYRDLFRDIFLN